MPHNPLFSLDTSTYPSGRFSKTGEHLRIFTRDDSNYTPPVSLDASQALGAIVVPTHRDPRANRDNLLHIMQLAQDAGHLLVFLCSGAAKKELIADIARPYPNLHWLALDGPFPVHQTGTRLATTDSPIAYGRNSDTAPKRNFGLQLARLLGWPSVFFLDDDISLTIDHLRRATDLLQGEALVVGFSARQFPDHSVVVHVNHWVDNPIDSFIGGGALAVKTSGLLPSFFAHIYDEDWLFLLPYCLLNNDALIWAGTVRQRRYNPFQNRRALLEEPGDVLAEGLFKLVMAMKSQLSSSSNLSDALRSLADQANENFWEHELNQRVLFIRATQAQLRRKRLPLPSKWRAQQSLNHSLQVLTGRSGLTGLRARELAAWVQAWVHDLQAWNAAPAPQPLSHDIPAAIHQLGDQFSFIHHRSTPAEPTTPPLIQTRPAPTVISSTSSEPLSLPDRPRSAVMLAGLRSTLLVEKYLHSHGLKLEHVVKRGLNRRYDRPVTDLNYDRPAGTIAMLIAAGESPMIVSQALRNLARWSPPGAVLQCVIWVYGSPKSSPAYLDTYRNHLTAWIVPELAGTTTRLRSSIITDTHRNLDRVINEALVELMFDYWRDGIHASHPVFVANSRNELLRWGTFYQFVRQEHWIPSQSLEAYLKQLPPASIPPHLANKANQPITAAADQLAIQQARARLAGVYPEPRAGWLRLSLRRSPTAQLTASLHRAGLTWLQTDDLGYDVQYHDPADGEALLDSRSITCVPVTYAAENQGVLYMLAQQAMDAVAARRHSGRPVCFLAITAPSHVPRQQLEDFRSRLTHIILSLQTSDQQPLLLSFTYQPEAALPPALLKARITAVARYAHWLYNHQQAPVIHWHEPDRSA